MTMVETVPAPTVSRGPSDLPADACDTHSHVFGPFDRFPPLRPSVYALPDASPPVHEAMRTRLGTRLGVLTQPAPYADDPSAMLHAIAGSSGALRAVAVAGPDIDDAMLQRWRAGGIVGLRFTEMRAPGGDRYPGSEPFDSLITLAPRMRTIGMHAQLWAGAPQFAQWLPRLLDLGIPLVLDHMGCPDPARGIEAPEFRAIIDALDSGNVWVKLVLARVSRQTPDYEDARPLHDALIAAAPDRMLWGSDWPYVRLTPAPDAGHMLRLFHCWVPDEATRRKILVQNPARLYDFAGETS